MATRRGTHPRNQPQGRWAKAAGGFGEGLQQVMAMLLQGEMAKDQDERRYGQQMALQGAESERELLDSLMAGVMDGSQDPSQAAAIFPEMDFAAIQPPMPRRRAFTSVQEQIDKASTPEDISDTGSILARTQPQVDLPGLTHLLEAAGLTPDALLGTPEMQPDVAALARQANTKREALRRKPTTLAPRARPDGSVVNEGVSLYGPGVETQLSAEAQGALEGLKRRSIAGTDFSPEETGRRQGQQEGARLDVVGPALTAQAGREAESRARGAFNVDFSPQAVNARVNEANRKSAFNIDMGARSQLDVARQMLDVKMKEAENALLLLPREQQTKAWADDLYTTQKDSDLGLRDVGQLKTLYAKAKPHMDEMFSVQAGGVVAGIAQNRLPRGALHPDVQAYLDAWEFLKPRIARSVGQVGNFTEQEQARAGLGAPDLTDHAQGLGDEKFDRLEALFSIGPELATLRQPGMPAMSNDTRRQVVEQRVAAAVAEIRRRRQGTGQGTGQVPRPGDLRLNGQGLNPIRP